MGNVSLAEAPRPTTSSTAGENMDTVPEACGTRLRIVDRTFPLTFYT
jgi:hypothetical protein